jgi:hypothetical protein
MMPGQPFELLGGFQELFSDRRVDCDIGERAAFPRHVLQLLDA